MTIKEQDPPKVRFVSDGTIVPWPFQWRLFSPTYADLIIEYDGVAQVVDASNFTIDYDEGQEAGSVTAKVAPPNGVIIVMRRKTAVERTADFNNINDFKGKPVNLEFDRFLAIAQEHAEDISRSVRRSAKSGSSANLDLPEPVANRAIKWNAAASGFENSEHDIDTLGDEVAGNKAATDQALADAQAVLAQTQAALTQVQALTVNAQNSAAAAEAAFQAFPAGMVKRISADYAIPVSENGYHYVIDGTGNDVDLIAPLGAEALEPFGFSTQRADSSDNTVRIVASGDNTFNNGQTQIILPYANSGASLKLDVDPEPDNWSVATSGAMSQLQEQIYYFTATAGQTVFTGADDFARTLGFVPGRIEVYRGPFRLWKERGDYSDASGDAVVLDEGAEAGEEITVIARSAFAVADTMSIAEVEAAIAAMPNGEIGQMAPFGMASLPNGWLACDGSEVGRTSYPDLFAVIGTTYGAGDGAATFNLPDQDDIGHPAPGIVITLKGGVTLAGAIEYGTGFSVSRLAAGQYRVTFDQARPNAEYNVEALAWENAGTSYAKPVLAAKTAEYFELHFWYATSGRYDTRFTFDVVEVNAASVGVSLYAIKAFNPARVLTPGPSGVNKAGDTMTGNLVVPAGTLPGHAVNKGQLDQSGPRVWTHNLVGRSSFSSVIPEDDTLPQDTEGNEVLTVTVAPSHVGRKLLVTVNLVFSMSSGGHSCAALFVEGSPDAVAVAHKACTSTSVEMMTLTFIHTATTTSPTKISVRAGLNGAGTIYINGRASGNYGGVNSTLNVMEVA